MDPFDPTREERSANDSKPQPDSSPGDQDTGSTPVIDAFVTDLNSGKSARPEFMEKAGPKGGRLPKEARVVRAIKTADAGSLFRAFQRRWTLALSLGLIAGVTVACATWFLLPNAKFYVRSLVHIASVPPQLITNNMEPRVDFLNYKKTQQALIKSRPVITKAIRPSKIAELSIIKEHEADIYEWLEKDLKADFNVAPEILSLGIRGDKPEELKALIDAITDAYIDNIANNEDKIRRDRFTKLIKLNEEFDTQLRQKKDTLTTMAKALGTNTDHATAVQQEYALKCLHEAQNVLMHNQFEQKKLEVELVALQSKEKALPGLPIPEKSIVEYTNKDPGIEKSIKQIGNLEKDLGDFERLSAQGKDSPKYKRILRDIEAIQKTVAEQRAKLNPLAVKEIREQIQRELQARIIQLRDNLDILKKHEKELKGMVDLFATDTHKKNDLSVEIVKIKDEITSTEEMTKRVTNQLETLKMEMLSPSRITRLEEASESATSDKKIQLAATGGAGLGALALVIMAISWWEFKAQRIHSLEEVVQNLGMNVMGSLPALPYHRDRAAGSGEFRNSHGQQLLTESVDTTRTMLLHAAWMESLQVVMVTSALSGEGKTSLASQLSASLARAGRRTLLIDGDLRNPAAHEVFHLPAVPGFNELIRGEADIAQTILTTPVNGLWMMPAGRWNAYTTQLLAQDRVQKILHHLKAEYDFIIMDSSPVLAVVDPLLIGQQVDAALFSILHEVSQSPSVFAAHQRLETLGIRVLGAVINGVKPHVGYGYGYGNQKYAENVNNVTEVAS